MEYCSNFSNTSTNSLVDNGKEKKSPRASSETTSDAPIPTPATAGHWMLLPGNPLSTLIRISSSRKQLAAPYADCPIFPMVATMDEKQINNRIGSFSVKVCKMYALLDFASHTSWHPLAARPPRMSASRSKPAQ